MTYQALPAWSPTQERSQAERQSGQYPARKLLFQLQLAWNELPWETARGLNDGTVHWLDQRSQTAVQRVNAAATMFSETGRWPSMDSEDHAELHLRLGAAIHFVRSAFENSEPMPEFGAAGFEMMLVDYWQLWGRQWCSDPLLGALGPGLGSIWEMGMGEPE